MQPEQLRELVLFEGLPDEHVAWCAPLLEEVEVPAGERICGRGGGDHTFFIVVLGEVDLLRDLRPAVSLESGQFWERPRPLVDARSFVAIAATDCWIARMLPQDYDLLQVGLPVVGERIDETVQARAHLLESN